MNTNRKIQVSFCSKEGTQLGSVILVMDKETIGKWLYYLLDQYDSLLVKDVED